MSAPTLSVNSSSDRAWPRTYWVCQVVGWGLYVGVGLSMVLPQSGANPAVLTGYGLYFLYSIGLTDGLRRIVQRRGWMQLSPGKLILRLLLAALAISTIQAFLVLLVQALWLWQPLLSPGMRFAALMWLNSFAATLVWTILYAGVVSLIQTSRARRAAVALELAAREARLKSLEAQLSPHFLFNCLNNVRGMIGEDPEVAQDMVTRLANILRHNLLAGERTLVPLGEQVEVVHDYLRLEAVRFEERLQIDWAIEEAAKQVEMPAMLLQTLVENAIKHGISRLSSGGVIKIQAQVRGDWFSIEVRNTGTLLASPIIHERANSTGVGLRNLQERLKLLEGAEASFALKQEGDEVCARIQFPATKSKS